VWAYKKYAELKESGKLPAKPEKQFLGDLEIVNDLEAPVFHKYLLLPVMKTWLRQQSGAESAFMTGSGSTMVVVLAPDVTAEQISVLKKGIQSEFGETMWVTQVSFLR
jgi:4-diphosphocytidyl-2-C-methyl-D-erythritol kinase